MRYKILFIFLSVHFVCVSFSQEFAIDSTDEFTFERVLITKPQKFINDTTITFQIGTRFHQKTKIKQSVIIFNFPSLNDIKWENLFGVTLLQQNGDTLQLNNTFSSETGVDYVSYYFESRKGVIEKLIAFEVKKIRFSVGRDNLDFEIKNRRIFKETIFAINFRLSK